VRVSVVVPCYNATDFIGATLRSILSQVLPPGWDLEVLVVDDGSTDSSAEVLAELDHPELTVLAQPNSGNVAARNLALDRATGDVVAFCDADDVWYPGKVVAQLGVLGEDGSACCCAVRYLSPAGDVLATRGVGMDEATVRRLVVEEFVMPVPLSGWAFRRSTSGLQLRMDEGLPVGADFELALRASLFGRVSYVPRPLVGYRVHSTSITSSRLVTQQQVRRFLMARQAGDPAAEAGFHGWATGRRRPWTERTEDFSARQVRRGADAWAAGARGRAGLHFLAAAGTSPRSSWRKARRVAL